MDQKTYSWPIRQERNVTFCALVISKLSKLIIFTNTVNTLEWK